MKKIHIKAKADEWVLVHRDSPPSERRRPVPSPVQGNDGSRLDSWDSVLVYGLGFLVGGWVVLEIIEQLIPWVMLGIIGYFCLQIRSK